MIIYHDGTAFNTPAKAIVNTINTVGVMGAGIALEFALRYPKMNEDYVSKCEAKLLHPGKVDYYKCENGIVIVNFPTKWHFKYPSKIEWIEEGLKDFVNTYKEMDISSVAFPRLGCANGGLSWSQVQPIMERALGNLDIEVYICKDKLPYAEGVEAEMLKLFNNDSVGKCSKIVKLSTKQANAIEKAKPYKRFWQIADTEGIGLKTYSNLFRHYYLDVNGYAHIEQESEQTSLFE